jgi:hypothetical protein
MPRSALLRLLDEAGWNVVRDRIIRGICHDLNGRANAVSNIGFLMEGGETPWPDVEGIVEGELQRLDEASRLLRLLPDDEPEIGLLAPGDLLRLLPSLIRLQPGLEHVEVRPDAAETLAAIRMDETLFTRALLVLASRAAEDSLLLGNREVRLADRGPEGTVVVGPLLPDKARLEPVGTGDLTSMIPPGGVERVSRVIRGTGGRLTAVERGEGPGYLEWSFSGASG